MNLLQIGGLAPWSSIDYPGAMSAVVFCQGCPWRCLYCHNPHLLPRKAASTMALTDVLHFLQRRRGLLDAVVFSGGEPTLQAGLPDALMAVRDMGFRTGLHTAGIYPERLRAVLPLLDWVGLDIKAPFERYASITGVADSGWAVRDSLQYLLDSKVAYELRTTVHTALFSAEDLVLLDIQLLHMGARPVVLQKCRPQGQATNLPYGAEETFQQQDETEQSGAGLVRKLGMKGKM